MLSPSPDNSKSPDKSSNPLPLTTTVIEQLKRWLNDREVEFRGLNGKSLNHSLKGDKFPEDKLVKLMLGMTNVKGGCGTLVMQLTKEDDAKIVSVADLDMKIIDTSTPKKVILGQSFQEGRYLIFSNVSVVGVYKFKIDGEEGQAAPVKLPSRPPSLRAREKTSPEFKDIPVDGAEELMLVGGGAHFSRKSA